MLDRKSTRLNSSHSQISYAVFCLKKKISRLITDHAIGLAVPLVESVAGEFFQQIENRICLFLRDFVCARATFVAIFSLLRHRLLLFLAHGSPEKIALRE